MKNIICLWTRVNESMLWQYWETYKHIIKKIKLLNLYAAKYFSKQASTAAKHSQEYIRLNRWRCVGFQTIINPVHAGGGLYSWFNRTYVPVGDRRQDYCNILNSATIFYFNIINSEHFLKTVILKTKLGVRWKGCYWCLHRDWRKC